jgi:serine O-acetyltransferase
MTPTWQPIQSKADLKRFILSDLKQRGLEQLPLFYQIRKPIIHYTVRLRKTEYLINTAQGPVDKLRAKISGLRLKRLGATLGFTISPNVFGPGLYLMHWGSIIISSRAHFGMNARIHSGVNTMGVQQIGDHVYLAPGAKLVGDITLGDNVAVGANCVVGTSQPSGVTLMGNPARVVKKTS